MKEEVAVQKVKVLDKVTYAEAVKVVKQRQGAKSQGMGEAWGGGRKVTRESVEEQQDRNKVWVDKKQVVIFVAAVINFTRDSTSKTTSIQIIAKAAKDYLGMEGLKWEALVAEINTQSSQELVRRHHNHGENPTVEC